MTLEELAAAVCKSKATLSKYEKGDIVIDIETLYEIADALEIHIDQLLVHQDKKKTDEREIDPVFFRGRNRLYAYFYDGRIRKINRTVCDILSKTDVNQFKLIMYMNYRPLSTVRKYLHRVHQALRCPLDHRSRASDESDGARQRADPGFLYGFRG